MIDVLTRGVPNAPKTPDHTSASASPVRSSPDDPRVRAYMELFDQGEDVHEPHWLRALRRGAIERFLQLGFPTTKNEDWHFTSVAPIAERAFTPDVPGDAHASVTAEDLAPFLYAGEWDTLVFVNGVFVPGLSAGYRMDGDVSVGTVAELLKSGAWGIEQQLAGLASYHTSAFTGLNTAFMRTGAFIGLRPNAVASRPVHVLYVTTDAANGVLISPRNVIIADHHSEITVVESYVTLGTPASFTNAVTELYLSPNAHVRHYKVQRDHQQAFHVGSTYAHQQEYSHYESFSFATGGALSRTNISTVLDGEGAHTTLNGLYMVDGTQIVDHQTRIEHAKPECTSHELYKGVLDGASHGVFNGKVYVRAEAQKTDGKQSNNNLLLSDRARVDTKPQLEIFADDVKCTHGATVGRLDATALFYLKSRGISEATARKLLTYAFTAEVLEELTVPSVRERLESLAFARYAE